MAYRDQLDLAIAADEAGRYDEALRIVLAIHEEAQRHDVSLRPPEFMLQLAWIELAKKHEPARAALAAHRDAQVARLLAGDLDTEGKVDGHRQSRFWIIAGLNEELGDARATHQLFLAVLDRLPDHASRCVRHALPALIEVGDFTVASRYMPDPLPRLADLNCYARELPLFPPAGAAPRLAAELSNFMQEVWQCVAILDGLGRQHEATVLRDEVLAAIESDELRAMAQRELDAPGTITSAITEHQLSLDPRWPKA